MSAWARRGLRAPSRCCRAPQVSRYIAQELERWRKGITITTDDEARRLYEYGRT